MQSETVLKAVCWGLGSVPSGQAWFLWTAKREQSCRMCVEIHFLWPGIFGLSRGKNTAGCVLGSGFCSM